MKFVFPFVLITLLTATCTSEPVADIETSSTAIDSTYCHCTDLIFNEPYNHFYLTDKRTGFTGKCEDLYPGGQMKLQKNFVNGKLHGKVTSWHENGQVYEEKEYDTNFQIGEQITYTDKGEVKFHALYERGKQVKVLVTKPDLPLTDEWD